MKKLIILIAFLITACAPAYNPNLDVPGSNSTSNTAVFTVSVYESDRRTFRAQDGWNCFQISGNTGNEWFLVSCTRTVNFTTTEFEVIRVTHFKMVSD